MSNFQETTAPKTYCNKCELTKPIEDMVSNKAYGLGYKYLCKQCDSISSKIRRIKNREKVLKIGRESYRKNRVALLKQKREKYPSTREAKKAYNTKYAAKNRHRILAQQRSARLAAPPSSPANRIRKNISSRITKSLNSMGLKKSSVTWNILGTNKEGLIRHFLETQGIDITNKSSLTGMEVDHICPVAQAKNENEFIALNHHTNLQLLSRKENQEKRHNKTIKGEHMCRTLLNREWIEHDSRRIL